MDAATHTNNAKTARRQRILSVNTFQVSQCRLPPLIEFIFGRDFRRSTISPYAEFSGHNFEKKIKIVSRDPFALIVSHNEVLMDSTHPQIFSSIALHIFEKSRFYFLVAIKNGYVRYGRFGNGQAWEVQKTCKTHAKPCGKRILDMLALFEVLLQAVDTILCLKFAIFMTKRLFSAYALGRQIPDWQK